MGSGGKGGASAPRPTAPSSSGGGSEGMMKLMEMMMLMQQNKQSIDQFDMQAPQYMSGIDRFDMGQSDGNKRPTETIATRRPIINPQAPEEDSLLL